MTLPLSSPGLSRSASSRDDQTRIALTLLSEAWEEARLDGVDLDSLTQAAIFLIFNEVVEHRGEAAALRLAESLPHRIETGDFSINPVRQ
jgi:hypothetical protein